MPDDRRPITWPRATAALDEAGRVLLRNDIYGYDAAIVAALDALDDAGDQGADLFLVLVHHLAAFGLAHALRQVQPLAELVVVADLDSGAAFDLAAGGCESTGHEVQQSGLAGTRVSQKKTNSS